VPGVDQLLLDRGKTFGVDVDKCYVPTSLGKHSGGYPTDPGGAAGAGDNGGALLG
jgi:hypothetical protein